MSYVLKLNQATDVYETINGKKVITKLLSNKKYLIDDINNEQVKIMKLSKGTIVRPASQNEESLCERIFLF